MTSPDQCPVNNFCAQTAPEGEPCGQELAHLQPLPLAEAMCPRALAGQIDILEEQVESNRYPASAGETYERLAWHEFELGLITGDPDHHDRSLRFASLAAKNPHTFFQYTLSASMLRIGRPALLARRHGLAHDEQAFREMRQGLHAAYTTLSQVPVHVPQSKHILDAMDAGRNHQPCLREEGERKGLGAKVIGLMIASRQHIGLYVASQREARSSQPQFSHDGYVVAADNQKVPIKIRTKSRTNAGKAGKRAVRYDGRVIYIDMNALLRTSLEVMQDEQPRQYADLAQAGKLGLPDVGRMLRDETEGMLPPHAQTFLDIIGNRFAAHLPESAERPLMTSFRTAENLQARRRSREKVQEAFDAHGSYLRYGHTQPSVAMLRKLITTMHRPEIDSPVVFESCKSAYIDLACHPETPPDKASYFIDQAVALTREFTARVWTEVKPTHIERLFRLGLKDAYAPKYKKALHGEQPNLNDETLLFARLLGLGGKTLAPAKSNSLAFEVLTAVRGVQFEIAIHLLNARYNLRHDEIRQSIRPSLLREDNPRDFDYQYRTGWDAAITTHNFLDLDQAKRLQLKSVPEGDTYAPNITTISGKEDLGTFTTADIIDLAICEVSDLPKDTRDAARHKLNAIEQKFLAKLRQDQ